MSPPKEGSRDIDDGVIISIVMDWCRSPTAIVPYRVWAKQVQAANLANSVRQTDNRSHVLQSLVLRCYGDEAGTGGGIISGTHNAECTPLTYSSTVRAEDRPMVRYLDYWWMNHRNTIGKLYNAQDLSEENVAKPPQIDPLMDPSLREFQASATAAAAPAAGVPVAAGPGAAGAGGVSGVGARIGASLVSGAGFAALVALLLAAMTTSTADEDDIRVTGRCKLVPFKDASCPKKQRHHVVADRAFRKPDGSRDGLSRGDGLVICLKGNARPRTLTTGHAVAQNAYDLAAAQQSKNGKLSLGNAEAIGAAAAALGAKADKIKCNPLSLLLQLRAYHKAKGLAASKKVRA